MQPVTAFPLRLYLLELAHYEANGVPVQGYLIQTSDGMNILIDTGWPQEIIGAYKRPGSLGIHMDEEDFVVQRTHYEAAKSSSEQRFTMNRQHWDHPALRYRLVDGDTELLPGIEVLETSGHVPGHQSVLVRLPETGPVLLAIDTITSMADRDPEQRAPSPWHMDDAGVRASTRKLVELAQREHVALIVHGHDPVQWQTLKKAPDYYR